MPSMLAPLRLSPSNLNPGYDPGESENLQHVYCTVFFLFCRVIVMQLLSRFVLPLKADCHCDIYEVSFLNAYKKRHYSIYLLSC